MDLGNGIRWDVVVHVRAGTPRTNVRPPVTLSSEFTRGDKTAVLPLFTQSGGASGGTFIDVAENGPFEAEVTCSGQSKLPDERPR